MPGLAMNTILTRESYFHSSTFFGVQHICDLPITNVNEQTYMDECSRPLSVICVILLLLITSNEYYFQISNLTFLLV